MLMNLRIRWHIAFWAVYLFLQTYIESGWISSSYADASNLKVWGIAFLARFALLIAKIPFSYYLVHLLNTEPSSRHAWRLWIKMGGALGVAILLYRVLATQLVLPYIYGEKEEFQPLFTTDRVITTTLDLVFVAGIVVAINQYQRYRRSLENAKMLEREKMEAEIKFLRAQMNPHFLFNTLNNIYALARKRSELTADVVMRLSKILRFMLYESRKGSIPISDELRLLQDYIELEKIRYNERLTVKFDIQVDTGAQPIAPLILLPFVDNAFKHGASETRFNSYINIEVRLHEGMLEFQVKNLKGEEWEGNVVENIGLSNVRRQLELMYPEHTLRIENGKSEFTIHLTINLLHYETV